MKRAHASDSSSEEENNNAKPYLEDDYESEPDELIDLRSNDKNKWQRFHKQTRCVYAKHITADIITRCSRPRVVWKETEWGPQYLFHCLFHHTYYSSQANLDDDNFADLIHGTEYDYTDDQGRKFFHYNRDAYTEIRVLDDYNFIDDVVSHND